MERIATWKLEKERKKVAKCIFCCLPSFCLFFTEANALEEMNFHVVSLKKNRKKDRYSKDSQKSFVCSNFQFWKSREGCAINCGEILPSRDFHSSLWISIGTRPSSNWKPEQRHFKSPLEIHMRFETLHPTKNEMRLYFASPPPLLSGNW